MSGPGGDAAGGEARRSVTVVVPCRDEEPALPRLAAALDVLETRFGHRYHLRFVFVDDGSVDGTWSALQRLFGARANSVLIRHDRPEGVTAAIMSGVRRADTEIVCSIDADCTYDPLDLGEMIPLLDDRTALVTASPHHPMGGVLGVPGWRLLLSRTASRLYRVVLTQKLATSTSCFRVFRRSAVAGLVLDHGGFLGMPEMLARLDLRGDRIVEYPTTLGSRREGRSKMRVGRLIGGHLRLLGRLTVERARRRVGGAAARARQLPSGRAGPA